MRNRKKLENVCASNTSLTVTAMNKPKKMDVTAIKKTPPTAKTSKLLTGITRVILENLFACLRL